MKPNTAATPIKTPSMIQPMSAIHYLVFWNALHGFTAMIAGKSEKIILYPG
jgi:hypothetical protein